MNELFFSIGFVSLIAFIIFLRKKVEAKKIIGMICAAIFCLNLTGCGGSTSNESKPAAENNLIGKWYCVKKDSSGTITSIIFLDIKDEKSAQMDSYELTNNKFAENTPNKLLWRYGSFNVDMSKSGKDLEFSVKVPDGDDIKVLECKFDSSEQKLISKEDTFTKEAVDVQKLKDESIQQYKNYLEGQGTQVEIVADMNEAEYKDYVNQQIFGMR